MFLVFQHIGERDHHSGSQHLCAHLYHGGTCDGASGNRRRKDRFETCSGVCARGFACSC